MMADFLISVSFSHDLPVIVSASNIPRNNKFFMFQAKLRENGIEN